MPLIYNLNILENIALIKEVQQNLPIKQAESIAMEFLQELGLSHLGLLRVNECSIIEVFNVMFIRALMTKKKNIIIRITHSVVDSLKEIKLVLENIETLNRDKSVVIVDLVDNENYYKGCRCTIIK